MERPLSGEVLHFDLPDFGRQMADPEALARSGRAARTLIKEGPLRVTLVRLAPGGRIAEHASDGPITAHILEGRVRFTVGDRQYDTGTGELLAIGAGVRHAVDSAEGGAFLLTIAQPLGAGGGGEAGPGEGAEP